MSKFDWERELQTSTLICPAVTLESGERIGSDVIVAADGLWPKCRESYLASQHTSDAPLPIGNSAYRIVLKLEDLEDPELRGWVSQPSWQFWIGPDAHVVGYSLRTGAMWKLVLLVPNDLPPNVARQHGSDVEMRQLFRDWDAIPNRFLDRVKSVDKWKLMHGPELGSWVGEQSNYVFVGDACHPMLPCKS